MITLKIIIITGMPGAGKSEVANAFQNADIPLIIMGDVIREEIVVRGEEITRDNLTRTAKELRKIADIEKYITKSIEQGFITQEIQVIRGGSENEFSPGKHVPAFKCTVEQTQCRIESTVRRDHLCYLQFFKISNGFPGLLVGGL